MTSEQEKVVDAFHKGARIEFKDKRYENDPWTTNTAPRWEWHNWDYRIAPDQPEFVSPYLLGKDRRTHKPLRQLYLAARIAADRLRETDKALAELLDNCVDGVRG